jgi:hypothetical protein
MGPGLREDENRRIAVNEPYESEHYAQFMTGKQTMQILRRQPIGGRRGQ